MGSKLVKENRKNHNLSIPQQGDGFLVWARQFYRSLVNASERGFKRSFPHAEQCKIFVSALRTMHCNLASHFNEDKQFMEQEDFLLKLVFVHATGESVMIEVQELMACVELTPEDFALFWECSQPYLVTMKRAEKTFLGEGKRIMKIDPDLLNLANWN